MMQAQHRAGIVAAGDNAFGAFAVEVRADLGELGYLLFGYVVDDAA